MERYPPRSEGRSRSERTVELQPVGRVDRVARVRAREWTDLLRHGKSGEVGRIHVVEVRVERMEGVVQGELVAAPGQVDGHRIPARGVQDWNTQLVVEHELDRALQSA